MARTTVLVIGGGQAGLAMSHCLSGRGIDHVVLERGRIGQRWRTTSWDSLRLLTPNWMTRLPGFHYEGPHPEGYMAVREVLAFLEQYARHSQAPVHEGTVVGSVVSLGDGFRVVTNYDVWRARAVVVATGYCDVPAIPAGAQQLPPWIRQLVPGEYRHPGQLSGGGVLIVGASSTGVQLADEITRSGRRVTLAVGRHTRLPRRYRGFDVLWWLDRMGVLRERIDAVHDPAISRDKPSLQLVGRAECTSLDLATLHAGGVRLTGRLREIDGTRLSFDDDLIATCAAADIKLAEIRSRIDSFIAANHLSAMEPEPLTPTWPLATEAATTIEAGTEGIETVIWATGYKRAYPWLHVPVLDGRQEIRHREGITPCPGLYVLGLNFQRRRNSSFIDGVGSDADFLAREIASTLADSRSRVICS